MVRASQPPEGPPFGVAVKLARPNSAFNGFAYNYAHAAGGCRVSQLPKKTAPLAVNPQTEWLCRMALCRRHGGLGRDWARLQPLSRLLPMYCKPHMSSIGQAWGSIGRRAIPPTSTWNDHPSSAE